MKEVAKWVPAGWHNQFSSDEEIKFFRNGGEFITITPKAVYYWQDIREPSAYQYASLPITQDVFYALINHHSFIAPTQ